MKTKHAKESEANAKLIAAAPDLLKVLQDAFISFPSYKIHPRSKLYKDVFNAIQKATLILCLCFILSSCSRNCVGHHPHTGQKFTKHSSGNAYRMMR